MAQSNLISTTALQMHQLNPSCSIEEPVHMHELTSECKLTADGSHDLTAVPTQK
jgi:hypothetical protein